MSYYQKIGKASDLIDKKERIFYRILEISPGTLSWGVFFLIILLSWRKPVLSAGFSIFFAIYLFIRSLYFGFNLKLGFDKMREYEKIDWTERLRKERLKNKKLNINSWQDIYHLIVFPMYKEPLEIVKGSFSALLKTDYPKNKMIVVLGCEERARDSARFIAKEIEKEFKDKFFKLLITWHPDNLPGEISGHGSNETWATKKAKELIIDTLKIPYQNIIVSSFDIDCQVYSGYFGCLTWHYLNSKNPTKTSFQPIPLYINNIWEAPIFSQIFSFTSTFWHTMNQERPEKLISFSSHAIPFYALSEVGFKQVNVVSDDSRIFWQCFFRFDGQYFVQPIYYPVSMDANVSKNFFRTAFNVYRQQRRWAYGVVEIPYVFFGFFKNKKIPFLKKLSFGFELLEGHFFWATAPLITFLLGWLPLMLGGEKFSQTVLSYNLPHVISQILTLNMFGLVFSAYLSFILLSSKTMQHQKKKLLIFTLGWLLIPLIMILFLALPALDAQTRLMLGKYMDFWPTEKVRK